MASVCSSYNLVYPSTYLSALSPRTIVKYVLPAYPYTSSELLLGLLLASPQGSSWAS